jgi:SAM-dependent methyltransferase
MNYVYDSFRSLRAQFSSPSGYYSKKATFLRLTKKPFRLAEVFANRLFHSQETFEFAGQRLLYFHHPFNNTSCNERTIEIPIARHFLKPGLRVLEVGNVLNHYGPFPHDVVDKYEVFPGVTNKDILDFTSDPYDLIVSISTLEHLGWDEPEQDGTKPFRAMKHLRHLLRPEGAMVVTLPHGCNPHLDAGIDQVPCGRHWRFLRLSRCRGWREVDHISADVRYGSPYPAANALHVLFLDGKGQPGTSGR